MKRLSFLLALLLSLALLSACRPEPPSPSGGIRFTDDTGVEVSLSSAPRRVAVLFSSYAEIWQTAGGMVAVTVGESVTRGLVSADTPLVDAGAGKTINTELLLSLSPDLVIASCDIPAQSRAASLLREAGVPTALFRVECFADYLRVLDIFTRITGHREAYEQYGQAQAERIDTLLSSLPEEHPSVLFLRAGSTASATKSKRTDEHFAAAMLSELGAVNVADGSPALSSGLSLEAVLLADPHAIFITTMGDEAAARAYMESLLATDAWQTLTAVREGRVYFLSKDLFQYKPNGRWADAYQALWELLYV